MRSAETEVSSSWQKKVGFGHFLPGYEQCTDCLRVDHGRLGRDGVGSCGGALPDATGVQDASRLRSFCRDGLRSADLQGKLAGYRDLSERPTLLGLSHGHQGTSNSHQSGLCQRSPRLACLCGGCRGLDASRSETCRRRPCATGIGCRFVRPGCDGDRVEYGLVSVGSMEKVLGLGKAQRVARLARRDPCFLRVNAAAALP